MDPAAHTFTGAALAAAGLRRATPLATAALILGANAPDVDAVTLFAGEHLAIAHRRGWTHGVAAIVVLPFLVTGLLLGWDRWVRRRRWPDADAARAGPLLAVAALGVATHPVLDWLNNYGMRWLMPFDDRWFYGDALFIIDPWIWLALGGVVFLASSQSLAALASWAVFWLLASALVLISPQVPDPARGLWVAGLAAVLLARALRARTADWERRVEHGARIALTGACLYMAGNLAANTPAQTEVRAELAALGVGPVTEVMIGPVPANPLAAVVVAETADAYYRGRWHWLAEPRFELTEQISAPRPQDPVFAAAARTRPAQHFLIWSRFPYAEIQADTDGYRVRFGDARYPGAGGAVGGPTVRLDHELQPLDRTPRPESRRGRKPPRPR